MAIQNKTPNKDDCYAAIDEAVLRLAVLSMAEEDGKKLVEQNHRYSEMKEFQLPDNVKHRILQEIRKNERKTSVRNNMRRLYPVLSRVAMVFLAISICFYTTFAVSAEFRRLIYKLLITPEERYTQISIADSHYASFADTHIYSDMTHAFGLTYIPGGFELNNDESEVTDQFASIVYVSRHTDQQFIYYQNFSKQSSMRVDTENADYWNSQEKCSLQTP